MKSKITIEIDDDNQPIIKINYVESEDVRDSLVKRFLDTFGSEVCWAKFNYINYSLPNKKAILRPISAYDLPEEAKTMTLSANEHLKIQKQLKLRE